MYEKTHYCDKIELLTLAGKPALKLSCTKAK